MLETFCSNKTSGAEKTENLRSFFTFFFIFCLVCLKISIVFKNSWKSKKWPKMFVFSSCMTILLKKCVFDPFRGYICKKAVQKLGNTVLRPIKIVKNRLFLKGCLIAAENQRKLIKIDFVSKSIFEFGPQDFLLPEIGRITFQIV